jgi:hypothetical protein
MKDRLANQVIIGIDRIPIHSDNRRRTQGSNVLAKATNYFVRLGRA